MFVNISIFLIGFCLFILGVKEIIDEGFAEKFYLVILAVLFMGYSIFSGVTGTQKQKVEKVEEGYYQMNVDEAIENGSDDIDRLALKLIEADKDTFKIIINKGKRMSRLVCSINEDQEDSIIIIDADDIIEMQDKEIIKKVKNN